MIGHPVLKFGIPAGIRDYPVKPVKGAFVSVAELHQVQNFLLIPVAHHRAAVRRAVGKDGDPVNIGGRAEHKNMLALLNDCLSAAT